MTSANLSTIYERRFCMKVFYAAFLNLQSQKVTREKLQKIHCKMLMKLTAVQILTESPTLIRPELLLSRKTINQKTSLRTSHNKIWLNKKN